MSVTTGRKAKVELVGDRQILITRDFDAPKALVWKAFTTPELVRQWWHADRGEMTVCEIDLRVGGRWRYAMNVHGAGFEVAFSGEYLEIEPEERVVSTEVFEAVGGEGSVNTMTLTEAAGRTTMTTVVEHALPEHRDMHIASGMEGGMQDAFDKLEVVAASLDGATG